MSSPAEIAAKYATNGWPPEQRGDAWEGVPEQVVHQRVDNTIPADVRRFYEAAEQRDGIRIFVKSDGTLGWKATNGISFDSKQCRYLERHATDIKRLIREFEPEGTKPAARGPTFIPFSQLEQAVADSEWVVNCWVPRQGITLLSGLPKAGKSTLISRLLQCRTTGNPLAGRHVEKGATWIISEEQQGRWRIRGDKLGFTDSLSFMCRPFIIKPTMQQWQDFILEVNTQADQAGVDLITIDTFAGLAPYENENDAAEMQKCLMPVLKLASKRAVILVHHLKKSDSGEGTGSRGSGAIAASVDAILELRRYDPLDSEDTRRIIKGYGRPEDITAEAVINLTPNGYEAIGSKSEAVAQAALDAILDNLPTEGDGLKTDEINERLPEGSRVRRCDLLAGLNLGMKQGRVSRNGRGKSKSPFRYGRVMSVPVPLTGAEQTFDPPDGSVPLFREQTGTAGTDAELLVMRERL